MFSFQGWEGGGGGEGGPLHFLLSRFMKKHKKVNHSLIFDKGALRPLTDQNTCFLVQKKLQTFGRSIIKIINTNPRMFTPCKGACWARGPVVEFTPVSPSPLLHCLQKKATSISISKLNNKHTPRSSLWSKMRPKTAQF